MKTAISTLLRNFAKQESCSDYKADSNKVELLETYLWLRQLSPTLSFETFLERFQHVADFNDQNLKHPTDAVKFFCPRTAKAAQERGVDQWSAADVVKALAFYVDIVREAEACGQVAALCPLNAYLEQMAPAVKAGQFDQPEPEAGPDVKAETRLHAGPAVPAETRTSAGPSGSAEPITNAGPRSNAETNAAAGPIAPAETRPRAGKSKGKAKGQAKQGKRARAADPFADLPPDERPSPPIMPDTPVKSIVRPSKPGQTIAYRPPIATAQAVRGRTLCEPYRDEELQRDYVTFQTEDGQIYARVNLHHCEVLAVEMPPFETPTLASELAVDQETCNRLQDLLQLKERHATIPLGDSIEKLTCDLSPQVAVDLVVRNGEQGPYLEAELVDLAANDVVSSLPPRFKVLGDYWFRVDQRLAESCHWPLGVIALSVVLQGDAEPHGT